MDIAEFLTRCLDEDEDEARDLLRGHPGPWRVDSPSEVRDSDGQVVVADEYHWTPMQYIARHDPARALADIAAKRKRLALHQRHDADPYICAVAWCKFCTHLDYDGDEDHQHIEVWPCLHLRIDAGPYADRPGYDPEWAI